MDHDSAHPGRQLRSGLAHLLFRAWPFSYGLERLLDAVDPLPPPGPVTTKLRGFPLRLTYDPQSYIGRFLYYRGLYEDATVEFLRRILRPGMNFVDVGANIGLYSTVAASLVQPAGRVLAIEPQEDMCELVGMNARQNGLTNVTVVRTALGRSAGTARLHQLYSSNPSAATLQLQADETSLSSSDVPIQRLGDLLAKARLGDADLVVKIDVEGAELEVLAGANEYFTTHPPTVILVECVDHHLRRFGASSVDLLTTLHRLGYRVSALRRGRRLDLDPAVGVDADVIAWRPDRSPW
jgi:FkbM family methyltransferase